MKITDEEIEELLKILDRDKPSIKKKICECGSEKVYGSKTTHSNWCPKSGEKHVR